MNAIVHTSQDGQRRPTATSYELRGIQPTGNIRRPQVANHPPRLTCSPEELERADRARV